MLRNIHECSRYEVEVIRGGAFDINLIDPYVMPEFRDRIKAILLLKESPESTQRWNMVLRDIIFSAVNDDYDNAARYGISMKTAGFADSMLRVLAAMLTRTGGDDLPRLWKGLSKKSKGFLKRYFLHPEINQLSPDFNSLKILLGKE
jgi:hypothetical protein